MEMLDEGQRFINEERQRFERLAFDVHVIHEAEIEHIQRILRNDYLICDEVRAAPIFQREEQQQDGKEKGHHGGGVKWREKVSQSDSLPKRLDEVLLWRSREEGASVRAARGDLQKESLIVEEFALEMAFDDEAEVLSIFLSPPPAPLCLCLSLDRSHAWVSGLGFRVSGFGFKVLVGRMRFEPISWSRLISSRGAGPCLSIPSAGLRAQHLPPEHFPTIHSSPPSTFPGAHTRVPSRGPRDGEWAYLRSLNDSNETFSAAAAAAARCCTSCTSGQ